MLEFHLFNYVGETINLHKNLQSANERYTRKKWIVNGHCSSFFFIRDDLPTIVDFSRSSLHFDIFSTDHTNDMAIRKVNSRNGLKATKHEHCSKFLVIIGKCHGAWQRLDRRIDALFRASLRGE